MLRLQSDLDGILDLPVLQPPSADEDLAPQEDLFHDMPVNEDIVQGRLVRVVGKQQALAFRVQVAFFSLSSIKNFSFFII